MRLVNIHEAKTHFSRLLKRIAKGEEIVIARAGKPIARLTRYENSRTTRKGGQWKGQVWLSDDFDAPLPPDIDEAFQGLRP
jgi:prevent-host-death family protein